MELQVIFKILIAAALLFLGYMLLEHRTRGNVSKHWFSRIISFMTGFLMPRTWGKSGKEDRRIRTRLQEIKAKRHARESEPDL